MRLGSSRNKLLAQIPGLKLRPPVVTNVLWNLFSHHDVNQGFDPLCARPAPIGADQQTPPGAFIERVQRRKIHGYD